MTRIKNKVKHSYKLLTLTILMFFSFVVCFPQESTSLPDSSQVTLNSSGTGEMNQEKNMNQEKAGQQIQNRNQGNTQKAANINANAGAVKQVRSARPDMSKAKGARPNIVRPSGSAIPKGAGKPGGVKRIGGR